MYAREAEHAFRRRFLGAALIALAAAGCGGEEGAETGAPIDSIAADPAPAAAPTVSDPEIAAILAASDTAEIQPSQLAGQKAQNTALRDFAQRMINDHGMLSDSLQALALANGITPAPSALSQQIHSRTQTTLQQLQGLSGAGFDVAYARAMADSHQAALTTIDSQLIPSARNPQLRTALEQRVRPTVAMHLDEIRRIEGSLGAR